MCLILSDRRSYICIIANAILLLQMIVTLEYNYLKSENNAQFDACRIKIPTEIFGLMDNKSQ